MSYQNILYNFTHLIVVIYDQRLVAAFLCYAEKMRCTAENTLSKIRQG